MNAENPTSVKYRSPLFIQSVGIASISFFCLGIYVALKGLLSNQIMLNIDRKGINVNPKKSLTEYVEWKNIIGFSEIKMQSKKNIDLPVRFEKPIRYYCIF